MKGVIPDKFAKQTRSIMQINVDKMKGLRVIEFVQVYLFNRPPIFRNCVVIHILVAVSFSLRFSDM